MHLAVNYRVLYLGDRMDDVVALYGELDQGGNCVVQAQCGESSAVLATEAAFDFVIIDHCLQELGGELFLQQLQAHSPQAERLIIAWAPDRRIVELADAREAPLIRALHVPRASMSFYGAMPGETPGAHAHM